MLSWLWRWRTTRAARQEQMREKITAALAAGSERLLTLRDLCKTTGIDGIHGHRIIGQLQAAGLVGVASPEIVVGHQIPHYYLMPGQDTPAEPHTDGTDADSQDEHP